MKTRQAFVANSSSSSFIIGISHIPVSEKDAAETFFGKESDKVSSDIVRGLFNEFTEFKFSLKKLRKMAEKHGIDKYYDDEKVSNERYILSELASNFSFRTEYYDRDERIFEQFEREELLKKYKAKYPEFDGSRYRSMVTWQDRQKIRKMWYSKDSVRKQFIEYVEQFIAVFQKVKNPKFMKGTFADDCGEGELEHGDHWTIMDAVIRFSHH